MLAVIETHPVQYRAPVYRALQTKFGIPLTVIYGSNFSVEGYHDREFGTSFAWDTDLLSGYKSVFLSRVEEHGAQSFEKVSPHGMEDTLRTVAPKAVLLTGYSPHFNRVAFYIAIKAGHPILFRAETTDYARSRNPLKSLIRDGALRLGYSKTARILYIGKHSYQHYARLRCDGAKLIFSPYCVDTAPFRCDESNRAELRTVTRRELLGGADQVLLLFSGKLSARKRPDLILHALKGLPESLHSKVAVIFLGSGEMAAGLKMFADAEPRIRAFFPGFRNQTQLSAFYHAADLMVLPSNIDETWGLVVNEALHHGLPCVVSERVGCAPDLIENGVTGLTFRTDSVESLSSAMVRALTLVGREDIREACRNKVESYSVENAARGIAEAYSQIVNDPPRRDDARK